MSRAHDSISDRDRQPPVMLSADREPGIRLIDLSEKSGCKKRNKPPPSATTASQPPQQGSSTSSTKERGLCKRRTRYAFSAPQTRALEQFFDLVTHYPDASAMEDLSRQLALPVSRIQVWFQNRRAKFRRNSANHCTSSTSL